MPRASIAEIKLEWPTACLDRALEEFAGADLAHRLRSTNHRTNAYPQLPPTLTARCKPRKTENTSNSNDL